MRPGFFSSTSPPSVVFRLKAALSSVCVNFARKSAAPSYCFCTRSTTALTSRRPAAGAPGADAGEPEARMRTKGTMDVDDENGMSAES